MLMSEIKVGDRILFGRPNGEKTLGKVVKKNRKTVKVETLEARGSRTATGAVWRVPPSLCVPADSNGNPLASFPKKTRRKQPQDLVESAMSKLTKDEYYALRQSIWCDMASKF